MTNGKEPTKRVKGESPWYLIVTCRSEDDIAAKVTLFARHVAEHGGADVNVSPNYTRELTRIHASFRELPNIIFASSWSKQDFSIRVLSEEGA